MQIFHRVEHDICVVSLKDRPVKEPVPKHEVKEILERLTPLFQNVSLKGAVLNFEGLEHISSGEIGDIVSLFQALEKSQIKLVLCQMNEKLSMLFNMTDLDKIISIYETEKEALASFEQKMDQTE